MDMLTAAGIGPRNYAERAKSFAIVVTKSPPSPARPQGMVYLGRHAPEEYEEFEQCLRDAANHPEKLEAAAVELMDIANLAAVIEDNTPDGRQMVGHGMHILSLILMQAGATMSDSLKQVAMTQCCMDSQVVYATWGPQPANRRVLMRIWYSLLQQYDCKQAAIKYQCEGFANTIARCDETNGETRPWQEEAKAIMERISVTQSSRTNFTTSIFSVEGAVGGFTTGPGGTPGADEQEAEMKQRSAELTEKIGGRSYTNHGGDEALENKRKGTPKTAAELAKAGMTKDVLVEPDEEAAKAAPVPDAVLAEETEDKAPESAEEKLASPPHTPLSDFGWLLTSTVDADGRGQRRDCASH